MRKLIVSEFVSVDGVMEAPGGEEGYRHTGWVLAFPQDPGQAKYKLDEVLDADARLMVFPVVLGSGRRLFPDDAAGKTALRLADSKVFDSGVGASTGTGLS